MPAGVIVVEILLLTILQGKTCALLNTVQKFIEMQGWLLLTFFHYTVN